LSLEEKSNDLTPKIEIGFDAKRYFHNSTGLGNYARWLINEMVREPELSVHIYSTKKEDISGNFTFHSPENYLKTFSSVWRSRVIVKDLLRDQVKIYHGLSNELPFGIHNTPIKSVVTIHDLINLRFPENYNAIDLRIYRRKLDYAIKQSNAIVTPSIQTKIDILENFEVEESKIHVIQLSNALSPNIYTLNHIVPYILCVSSFNKRKNIVNLVKAYQASNITNTKLILAGRDGDTSREVVALAESVPGVEIIPNPDENKIAELYNHALFCVYPSLFEGFGLPILEAFSYGKTVATSNISSMPEVGGNAALYFNPYEIKDMSNALNKLMSENERTSLMDQIPIQMKKFESKELIKSYMKIYKAIITS
jgi:glycosyltransferase involved in cell wall biosynthesis